MLEQRQSFFLGKFHAGSMFLLAESGAFSKEQQLKKMSLFSQRQQILHFQFETHHQLNKFWLNSLGFIKNSYTRKPGSDEGSNVFASKTLMMKPIEHNIMGRDFNVNSKIV